MATRNRLSMAGAGGSALLDQLDAFKRKHVNQNKEIIHRNSDLMKVNGDLNKQLREVQTELMACKSENLRLNGTTFQLEIQIAHLKNLLEAERQRVRELEEVQSLGRIDENGIESLRQALQLIVVSAQQAQVHLNSTPIAAPSHAETNYERAPPPQALSSSSSSSSLSSEPTAFQQSRKSSEDQQGTSRPIACPPDLSHISEGSIEPEEERRRSSMDSKRYSIPGNPPSPVFPLSPSPSPPPPAHGESSVTRRTVPSAIAARRKSIGPGHSLHLLGSTTTLCDALPASPSTFSLPPVASTSSSTRPTVESSAAVPSGVVQQNSTAPPSKYRPQLPLLVQSENIAPLQKSQGKTPTASTATLEDRLNAMSRRKTRTPAVSAAAEQRTSLRKSISSPALSTRRAAAKDPSTSPLSARAVDTAIVPPVPVTRESHRRVLSVLNVQPINVDLPPAVATRGSKKTESVPVMEIEGGEKAFDESGKRPAAEATPSPALSPASQESEVDSQETNMEGAQSGGGGRRAKKSVNYALPNLRDKMRQPAGYVPSIKKPARHSHSIVGNGAAATAALYGQRLSGASEVVAEEGSDSES